MTEEINTYTIIEVWDIDDNESLKTQGIVTKVLTDKLLFIEDHSAVISVFGVIENIKVGDLIEIDGIKTSHNGLHQISLSSFNIVSSNHSLTDSIDFNLEWDQLILKSYQGQRFNIQSLLIHSIEQDTYGNLTFVLEDINTNVSYNGRYDSRLANVYEMTEHLLSLEDQIIYLEDVLLSFNDQPWFMFTSVDEISLTE
ncbi:hypothetical protein KHQ88_04480 [Mycoplasmatota bacterium]|nr:hypothetical protein KHQ88_04480 [Mycoplasmatota bacterium]